MRKKFYNFIATLAIVLSLPSLAEWAAKKLNTQTRFTLSDNHHAKKDGQPTCYDP
jgi:hypothetical protein